jgi:hypothetical protein
MNKQKILSEFGLGTEMGEPFKLLFYEKKKFNMGFTINGFISFLR